MSALQRFEGRVALVTGGARGIGLACAERFAAEGAAVACVDLDPQGLENAAATLRHYGGETATYTCDVTQAEQVHETVRAVLDQWGRIDILVAAAGIYRYQPLDQMTTESWNQILAVNLTGVMLFNRAVALVMIDQRAGSIINLSSMAGKTSFPASSGYSATKSGVIGLTRSVAMELAPLGITANAICPGNVMTEMMKEVAGQNARRDGITSEEWLAGRAGDCPMGRLGEPWEIAALAAFLASDDARYITGQSISIDGGMILS